MNKPPNSWKHYAKYPLDDFNAGFYQKTYAVRGDKVSAEFVSYPPAPPNMKEWSHELHMQIPSYLNATGMTINVKLFSYIGKRIDWKAVEKQVEVIIKALIKKV